MNEGIAFSVAVFGIVPAMACAWAGYGHVVAPAPLAAALRQVPFLAQVLPPPAARVLARAWGTVELTTGVAAGVVMLQAPSFKAQLWAVTWLAVMYLFFTLWLVFIWRRLPESTCGCSAGPDPADVLALARTILLGVGAVVALTTLSLGKSLVTAPNKLAVVPIAAILTALVWVLPPAIRVKEFG